MMRHYLPRLTVLLFFSFGLNAFGVNYYADFASGNDSNSGTSQASPWQHAPGMSGCTASCSSASPGAGDQVILKGGVTWPSSVLTWNWKWSGGSGNALYLGVDKSWFSGGSWSRPELDGGGSTVGANNEFLVIANSVQNLHVDDLEFTGLYWDSSVQGFHQSHYIDFGQADSIELSNLYFHGWSHGSSGSGTTNAFIAVLGDTHFPNQGPNDTFHNNVCDGSDTDLVSGNCAYGGPPTMYDNVCGNMSGCFITNGSLTFHDNLIFNLADAFDPADHQNGFESNCDNGLLVYNNVFHHVGYNSAGSAAPPGLILWMAPGNGKQSYAFNNVFYDGPTTGTNTITL
jgi:hypothetical protein